MGLIIIQSEFGFHTEFKQLVSFGKIIECAVLGVLGMVLGYCLEAVENKGFPFIYVECLQN